MSLDIPACTSPAGWPYGCRRRSICSAHSRKSLNAFSWSSLSAVCNSRCCNAATSRSLSARSSGERIFSTSTPPTWTRCAGVVPAGCRPSGSSAAWLPSRSLRDIRALHEDGRVVVAVQQRVGGDPGDAAVPAFDVRRREQILPQLAQSCPRRSCVGGKSHSSIARAADQPLHRAFDLVADDGGVVKFLAAEHDAQERLEIVSVLRGKRRPARRSIRRTASARQNNSRAWP